MASRISVRAARREDRDQLGTIKLRASLAWGDDARRLRALPEASRVPAQHLPFVIVARLAGSIVGFATVLEGDGSEAILEDLFVAPVAWRRGIGSLLVAHAGRLAVARGARSLRVVANERARAFYESRGFEPFGMVMTEFGPAPEMRKRLLLFPEPHQGSPPIGS